MEYHLQLVTVILFLGILIGVKGFGSEQNICSGGNETWSDTGNNACQNTCMNPNIAPLCDPIPNPGCICIDGFFRDGFGNCVLPTDCDACGGDVRKEFKSCGNVCPVTCANKDTIFPCPAICLPGECGCRPEYVEDIYGNCILPSECPDCGKNAHFACGSACDTECATLGEICPIFNKKCVERCYCNNGFARNENGDCIPINECPNCSDPNAEVVACPNPCPGGTCKQPKFAPCRAACRPYGCQCKKGYVKNAKGKCILLSKCRE